MQNCLNNTGASLNCDSWGAALPKPHGVSGISWTVTTKLCWADNAFISWINSLPLFTSFLSAFLWFKYEWIYNIYTYVLWWPSCFQIINSFHLTETCPSPQILIIGLQAIFVNQGKTLGVTFSNCLGKIRYQMTEMFLVHFLCAFPNGNNLLYWINTILTFNLVEGVYQTALRLHAWIILLLELFGTLVVK